MAVGNKGQVALNFNKPLHPKIGIEVTVGGEDNTGHLFVRIGKFRCILVDRVNFSSQAWQAGPTRFAFLGWLTGFVAL